MDHGTTDHIGNDNRAACGSKYKLLSGTMVFDGRYRFSTLYQSNGDVVIVE